MKTFEWVNWAVITELFLKGFLMALLIVLAREFRDGEMAVLFPKMRNLGPRAAKRGAGRKQQPQFLLGVFLLHHMLGRGKQFRELDQRGDSLEALFPQEGSTFFFRKAQCALTGLRRAPAAGVHFLERARRLALAAPARLRFHAAHERPPPTSQARSRRWRRQSAGAIGDSAPDRLGAGARTPHGTQARGSHEGEAPRTLQEIELLLLLVDDEAR